MNSTSATVSPRTRILGAFDRRIIDRPPVFDVPNNPDLYHEILGRDNHWSDPSLAVGLARALGLDAVMIPVPSYSGLIHRTHRWIDETYFVDRFGIGYIVTDSSWPLGFVNAERKPDMEFLSELEQRMPVPAHELDPIITALTAAHTGDSDELAVFGGLRSGFSFLNIAVGLPALSLLCYDDPALMHRFAAVATEIWTQIGLDMIEAGVDALYVANDMGMNGSTLISPDHLREFFLPPFFEQCESWKKAGGRVILHSCGNINAILPDLYEAGCIDAINNLQERAGMDIADVRQRYGHAWVMIGNVDATDVMTTENPSDIDTALGNLFDHVGLQGLIVATDHSFHHGIPVENVIRFIDTARRMGSERAGGIR